MNIWWALARPLSKPAPPPAGGWADNLPEAFGAKNASGDVFVIGYLGEWYTIAKPSPLTRLHNWLIYRGNTKADADGFFDRDTPARGN